MAGSQKNSSRIRVLAVDDEPHMADTLDVILSEHYQVKTAVSGPQALTSAAQSPPHVALLDVTMPGMSGLELLRRMSETSPMTVCVMLTGSRDVKTVVEAMKSGAFDYLTKPLDEQELLAAVGKAVEHALMKRELIALRSEMARTGRGGEMVGESPGMRHVVEQIGRFARQDVNVLITGESGTGKELVARAIHERGARGRDPFVAVNCSTFGSDIAESELFGHEKGAFTGALAMHRGKFEQADGGTLFLDEIGNMPLAAQAKLLRVLEERKVTRIGAERSIDFDVRIITATNSDLDCAVKEGRFRQDLFFRIAVLRIATAPLRERLDDLPLLVDHFLKKHVTRTRSPVRRISKEALDAMAAHSWPGNVRELENAVLSILCMCEKEEVGIEDLDEPVFRFTQPSMQHSRAEPPTRDELLRELESSGYNLAATARRLGVHRNTVRNMMGRLGIFRPDSQGN